MQQIDAFCLKWKIQELSIFGSAVRDDFDVTRSDVDVLYTFTPDTRWGLKIVHVQKDLEKILGHKVDLVSKRAIEKSRNPYRKKSILDSCKVIYAKAS